MFNRFLGISLENTHLVKIFMVRRGNSLNSHSSDSFSFVQEYLPNGTIENLLTSFGPFHNDVLKKYTKQIVEGVAYLHKNNVVHRYRYSETITLFHSMLI